LDHISLKGESSVDYLILDNTIHVLNIDGTEAQNNTRDADVVHYGGYAKPWLELGMGKYKSFWTRFLNFDNRILQECNVHK
jgi:alpha-1,4-galacturonosyltransferase